MSFTRTRPTDLNPREEVFKRCEKCGQDVRRVYQSPEHRTATVFEQHMQKDMSTRCPGSGKD